MKYIPEIDGLRAIAILLVLGFHFSIPGFDGGYIGVDVFYVISGFLITGIILRDAEKSTFSFKKFYVKRIFRLFPALFVTTIITVIVGYFLLDPAQYRDLAASAGAAVFSVSNFYFLSETGYFAPGIYTKPLLHTWSLSVEEQFYIAWPAMLMLLVSFVPKKHWLTLFILVIVLSFLLSVLVYAIKPDVAFYMTPLRTHEFALGALLAIVRWRDAAASSNRWFLLLGLILVVAPGMMMTEHSHFPFLLVVFPVVGTFLIIRFHKSGNKLLAHPVFLHLGKISYSLYLVHWPVVVYTRVLSIEFEPGVVTWLFQATLSYLLALFLYHAVENPLRIRRTWPFGAAIASTVAVFSISLVIVFRSGGLPERFGGSTFVLQDAGQLRKESWKIVRSHTLDTEGDLVVVLGDSHAKDTFNALLLNLPESDQGRVLPLIVNSQCADWWRTIFETRCRYSYDFVFSHPDYDRMARFIISQSWNQEEVDALDEVLGKLVTDGKQAVVMANMPMFPNVPETYKWVERFEPVNLPTVSRYLNTNVELREELNDQLQVIADKNQVSLVSKYGIYCPGSECEFVTDKNEFLISDSGHLTLLGAEIFGQRMLELREFGYLRAYIAQ